MVDLASLRRITCARGEAWISFKAIALFTTFASPQNGESAAGD